MLSQNIQVWYVGSMHLPWSNWIPNLVSIQHRTSRLQLHYPPPMVSEWQFAIHE